jgi:hypothetical protein
VYTLYIIYTLLSTIGIRCTPIFMTSSLKPFLARLARVLVTSEGTLYERQRALVREGLLESLPGQGRGSGVRASPDSLAMLLISFLSSVGLTDAALLTKETSKAKAVTGKCPLTGATTLREAVAKILADPALFDQVKRLSITGLRGVAEITYGKNQVSLFEGRASEKEGVRITMALKFDEMRGFQRVTLDMFRKEDQ